ncbi:unnamed protein product, partial [marine sediment metagenome]
MQRNCDQKKGNFNVKYDIFGIGSALIDLLIEIDDGELSGL